MNAAAKHLNKDNLLCKCAFCMSELSGCERDSSVVVGQFDCFIVDSWHSHKLPYYSVYYSFFFPVLLSKDLLDVCLVFTYIYIQI